jgi:hypothetical protein
LKALKVKKKLQLFSNMMMMMPISVISFIIFQSVRFQSMDWKNWPVEVVVGKNTTPLKYNAQPLLSGQVLQRPSIAG